MRVVLLLAIAACTPDREAQPRQAQALDSASSAGGPLPASAPSDRVTLPAKREVSFDGGVARIESNREGGEHILLISADGGILGESTCVPPLAGYDAVRTFFTEVRTEVLRGNIARVADSVSFPLRVNSPLRGRAARSRVVESREQFLEEHSRILTADVVERVREADPGRVSCNWQGQSLGDGVFWAELQANDTLAVWAINVAPAVRGR